MLFEFENCFVIKCIHNNCCTQYDCYFFSNSNQSKFIFYKKLNRVKNIFENCVKCHTMIWVNNRILDCRTNYENLTEHM